MHVYKVSLPRTGAGEERLKAISWKSNIENRKIREYFDILKRYIYEYRKWGWKRLKMKERPRETRWRSGKEIGLK